MDDSFNPKAGSAQNQTSVVSYFLSNFSTAAAFIAMAILFNACESPKDDPRNDQGSSGISGSASGTSNLGQQGCSTIFQRSFQPAQIEGNKHLYFNASDFMFLLDPQIEIDEITLKLTLKGNHKNDRDEDLSLDL